MMLFSFGIKRASECKDLTANNQTIPQWRARKFSRKTEVSLKGMD